MNTSSSVYIRWITARTLGWTIACQTFKNDDLKRLNEIYHTTTTVGTHKSPGPKTGLVVGNGNIGTSRFHLWKSWIVCVGWLGTTVKAGAKADQNSILGHPARLWASKKEKYGIKIGHYHSFGLNGPKRLTNVFTKWGAESSPPPFHYRVNKKYNSISWLYNGVPTTNKLHTFVKIFSPPSFFKSLIFTSNNLMHITG